MVVVVVAFRYLLIDLFMHAKGSRFLSTKDHNLDHEAWELISVGNVLLSYSTLYVIVACMPAYSLTGTTNSIFRGLRTGATRQVQIFVCGATFVHLSTNVLRLKYASHILIAPALREKRTWPKMDPHNWVTNEFDPDNDTFVQEHAYVPTYCR